MKRPSNTGLLAAATVFLIQAAAFSLMAETRIEKNLELAPGGKLILEADAGSVDLRGTSKSGAHILVTSAYDDVKDRYDFKFEENGGTVRIVVKKKGGSSWFSWLRSSHSPSFEIEVPTRTELDLQTGGGHIQIDAIKGDVGLETSGGHIQVTKLTGNLKAHTSGGHIALHDVDGDANIETSGGHIEVTSLDGTLTSHTSGGHMEIKNVTGDIEASTSGGSIQIEGAGGRVAADTSGGSVDVSFTKGNAKGGTIESSGGGITVGIDPGVNLTIDADTSGGRVNSDLPVTFEGSRSRSSLRGSIGKGGKPLKIHTSAGSIQIQSL